MKNIEFDRKSQFRIGKDKFIERNHFYKLADWCMEGGIFFTDTWGTSDGMWELRIIADFFLNTKQQRQISRELWDDAFYEKKEVFSRLTDPDQIKSAGEIGENGMPKMLVLQYDSGEDILADIESAANYIETRLKALGRL